MDLHNYKIGKRDFDEKNMDMRKKSKFVDEVSEMSKKMKIKYSSLPGNDFGASVSNNRLFNTGKPSKETLIGRKNMMFASIVE
jgi:hypothetical protein